MSGHEVPLVLHVIHHLVVGGMENGLVNIINRMSPTSFRHAIACIEDYSDFRQRIARPDVEVFALHRNRAGVWDTRKQLFNLCRRLQPAVVHSRNLSGLDALLPARMAGVRCCVHGEHGWDVGDLDGRARKPLLLRRLHAPLVSRYITVSKHIEEYLIRRVRVSPRRITQIYNGVDTVRFTPQATKPEGVMPSSFASPEIVVIGTVARIQAVKDLGTLVRAYAAMVSRDSALRAVTRLAIVGDGPLLDELRAQVRSLHIEELVWLPGARSDIMQVMRCLDVFVLPSLLEGISNTILEAMAAGIPVIATATGGNVELVTDRITGRLVKPGDVEGIAGMMAEYARDAGMRKQHGANSRQAALQRFSLERMVADYQRVYEQQLRIAR